MYDQTVIVNFPMKKAVFYWPACLVEANLSKLTLQADQARLICRAVLSRALISWLFYHSCSTPAVLPRLSYPGSPVMVVLPRLSCPVVLCQQYLQSILSSFGRSVLSFLSWPSSSTVLSWLFWPCCPLPTPLSPALLFLLTSPCCHFLTLLSYLSCPRGLVLAALYQLSCSSCPVWLVLSCPALAVPSWLL
jgi:hypothetical protein